MNITFDTNVILRLLMADNAEQLARARDLLSQADRIILPIVALSEAIWTMRRHYRVPTTEVADRIEVFVEDSRVRCDQALVKVGLAVLRDGGEFADAVIAVDGQRLSADSFATFDRDAARLLEAQGVAVTLLG